MNKVSINTEAIFRAGLSVARGKLSGGGYQSTAGEFVQSLQDIASGGEISTTCSPDHINLECSVIDQL